MSSKDSKDTAVEMFVGGLLLDRNTQAPVVILKDEAGAITLPIWIGIAEATSIASAINQIAMARPLTHDLMSDIFTQLGVSVQRILITELKEATYFAELVLSYGDKVLIFDARPSDAIAVALRASAPIFVTQAVLDQAKVAFPAGATAPIDGAVTPKEEGEGNAEGGEKGDEDSGHNFANIDKEKWVEILSSLDPDDFKYKM